MKRSKTVVIGVLSAAGMEERRRAVMTTWGIAALAEPEVDLVFLIGDSGAKMPRRDGHLLYLPCPDDYDSLPQKTRWFCLWALAHCDFQRLIKVDDDTYVRIDRLLSALAAGGWTQPLVGCRDGNGDHFHGGAGYLISREAALSIAARLTAEKGLEDWKARDAAAAGGMWFAHDDRFCFNKERMPLPGNEQITCHYCSPVRMRLIHDSFRAIPADAGSSIPRIVHHIWLGGRPIPERLQQYRATWARFHPGWEHKLWTEENLGVLVNQRAFQTARTAAQKSHLARYEILHREGGVYVDFDVECRKPLDDLLPGLSGFAGAEDDDAVGIAVLGAKPGDALLGRVIVALPESCAQTGDIPRASGSWFFTRHLLQDDSWRLFWWDKFYPVHYSGRVVELAANSYAVHHWEASWKK